MDLTYSYSRFGNPQHRPDDEDSTGEDSDGAMATALSASSQQRHGNRDGNSNRGSRYDVASDERQPHWYRPNVQNQTNLSPNANGSVHSSFSHNRSTRSVFGGTRRQKTTPAAGSNDLRDNETGGPFLSGLFSTNQNQYQGPDFSALRNSDEFSYEDNVSVASSSNHSEIVKEFPGTPGSVNSFGTLFRRFNNGNDVNVHANHLNQLGPGHNSFFGAVFIVCNAALGAAVLNLPYAFLTVGDLSVALAVQAVTVCLVFSTLFWLGYLAEVCQAASYESVIGRVWGRKVKLAVEIVVVIYALFSCIAYQVIVGDQMEYVLTLLSKHADLAQDEGKFREISIVLSAFVVLPLCIPRDISYLTYPGFISVVGVLYIAVAVVFRYLQQSFPDSSRFANIKFSWNGLTGCLPTFLFAYQCHVSSVPVYASLRKRSLTRWVGVITVCLLLVSAIYAVVGVFGFLTFGNSTYPDILMGYESDDRVMTAGRAMLLFSVLLSYPIMHYVARSAYENLLNSVDNAGSATNAIFTPAWLLISLSAALFIPGLNVVIQKVGATAAFFVLGFPGMCLVEMSRYSRHWVLLVLLAVVYTSLCAIIFCCSLLSFLN